MSSIEVATRNLYPRARWGTQRECEYHAAREDPGILQARLNGSKPSLPGRSIVDKVRCPTDVVGLAPRSRSRTLDGDEEGLVISSGPAKRITRHKILTIARSARLAGQ